MEKRTITVHFAEWDSYERRPKEFFSLRVWELLMIKDIQNDIFRSYFYTGFLDASQLDIKKEL